MRADAAEGGGGDGAEGAVVKDQRCARRVRFPSEWRGWGGSAFGFGR